MIDFAGYVYRHHSNQTTRVSTDQFLEKVIDETPIAFDFIHDVFNRMNLPEDMKRFLEIRAMVDYLQITAVAAYRRNPNLAQHGKILQEIIF